jgi:cell division protease FtsH
MHQQRQFSEHTQEVIDSEVARILNDAGNRAAHLLTDRRDELEAVTRGLLEREELSEVEIEELVGPSVHGPVERFGESTKVVIAPEAAGVGTGHDVTVDDNPADSH